MQFARPLMACLWCACTAAGPAIADDEIEEIVVEATRVPQTLQTLPFAVDVVDAEDIQRARPLLGLDEALQGVPGLLVQNRFNYAQDLRLSIRGFGARSAFGIRGVRVLVDGIPTTLPDGQSGVDGIDVGATGRVELLRGSAGARYGNAGGGVLLIETQPGDAEPTLAVRGALGSDGYRRQQVSISGTHADWNYRGSLSDLDYTGYRDHSATRNRQLSVRLARESIDGNEWLISLHHTDQPEAFDPGGITLEQANQSPRSARAANQSFAAGEALQQTRLGLRFERDLGARTRLLWRNYLTDRAFDGLLPFANGGAINLDRRFFGTGLQLAHRPGASDQWGEVVFGIDVDRQRDDRQRFVNNAGQRGALTLDQRENVSANGVFVAWQFRPALAWQADLALRHDTVEFDVSDRFLTDGNDGGTLDFDAWSPSVGLSWSPTVNRTIYFNAARSFETPTTTELANPGSEGGFNPELEPQTAVQYELGARARGQRHEIRAAVFRIDLRDELVAFELPEFPGRDFFANTGTTTREGIELNVRSTWTERWGSAFSYTFSDFRFDRFVDDSGNDFSGNQVPGTARHQYYFETRYSDEHGWLAAIEVARVGAISLNNAQTVATDPFTRVELRLARRLTVGGWRLEPFVLVSNALDEAYTANARINAFGSRYYEPGPDRAVFVGFDARRAFAN